MKARPQTAPAVTAVEYSAFQQAYDFYNTELFANTLPHVLVTLPHQKRSRGYFSADRFRGRTGTGKVHELALNPDEFQRTETEILSTLVHEMAHVWQQEHGHPGRGRYHNKEWAAKMLDLGLHPSSTGEPGGTMTGQRVSHYIVKNGPFAKATARLLKTGFVLNWQSSRPPRKERLLKAASKTKYSCPGCGLNVWAKPDVTLHCGECYDGGKGELITLEAELYALVGVR
jgi:hypothetical protein